MRGSEKGIAMLVVISLIIMLFILGGSVLMISAGHFRGSYSQIRRTRAFYAAEAAKGHVLWQLRTAAPLPGTLPLDFDVNGIEDTDIAIDIGPPGGDLPGVRRIDITVDF